jgi:hypothetical protein
MGYKLRDTRLYSYTHTYLCSRVYGISGSTHRAFNCSLLPRALRLPTVRRAGTCVGHSVAGQIVGSGARVHVALGDMQCAVARHFAGMGTAGR